MMSVRPHDIPPYPRGDGEQTPVAPKRSAFKVVLTAAGLLLVAVAVTVAAYPFLSFQWQAHRSEQQFTEERATAQQYDEDAVDGVIAEAETYNAVLSGLPADNAARAYEFQLAYDDSPVICWLDIPRLGMKLPVYRDDGADEVPADGAEHLRGTSLPVGGESSNTVITAHSGSHEGTPMAFNKLDLIEVGDIIVLWTLGRPYAYEVVGWVQTDPDDVSNMRVVAGIDQLTLLTCRPIGTTAKRLFVHAQRANYDYAVDEGQRIESLAQPDFWQFVAALGIGGLALWVLLLLAFRKKTVWFLNRALGRVALSEHDVAGLNAEGSAVMALELKSFKRARLRLFGERVTGSWKRDDDESRAILSFESRAEGPVMLRCPDALAQRGIETIALPQGAFEVGALDGELAFDVDGGATKLVFSRSRPQTREGHRDRSGDTRR